MPLYRNRIKRSILSQPSQVAPNSGGFIEPGENKTEKVSSHFKHRNSSQKEVEDILEMGVNMKSPVYPDAFSRAASEPSESAFVDVMEKGNKYMEGLSQEDTLENTKDTGLETVVYSPNVTDTELSMGEMLHSSIPIEKCNILGSPGKHVSSKTAFPDLKLFEKKGNKRNLETLDNISEKRKRTNKEKSIPKIPTEKNSTTKSQIKIKKNVETKTSKRDKTSNKGKPDESQASNSSQIFSQNSDISINDPAIKNAYVEFIKKRDKYDRVATPKGLNHIEKMMWLQEQRNVGVYVHCDGCDKIRYLEEIRDPTMLPEKWFCENNTDLFHNKCEDPEEAFPLHIQEDWIDNLYNAGSLVWAKVEGYPWWPGMVDDDPNTESYYWLDNELNNTPSYYHITFFDSKVVSRAWLKPHEIKPSTWEMDKSLLPGLLHLFRKRIDFAIKQMKEASRMPLLQRLNKFGFVTRYKKPIRDPKKVNLELKSDFKKGKKVKRGEGRKDKKGKKLKKVVDNDLRDLSIDDFELPLSPAIENISLDLFENV